MCIIRHAPATNSATLAGVLSFTNFCVVGEGVKTACIEAVNMAGRLLASRI